jgi:hypothetical protein
MAERIGAGSNTGAGYPQSKYGFMMHRPLHAPGLTPRPVESQHSRYPITDV